MGCWTLGDKNAWTLTNFRIESTWHKNDPFLTFAYLAQSRTDPHADRKHCMLGISKLSGGATDVGE